MSEKLKENVTEQSGHFGHLGVNDANLYSTYHVAISPNGQQVATFNTLTFELSICQVNSLTNIRQVKCDTLDGVDTSAKLAWSLAISNPIEIKDADNENAYAETLIALSCFDERDMMLGKSLTTTDTSTKIIYNQTEQTSSYDTLGNNYDEEKASDLIKTVKATTWIISTWHEARILTAVDDLGGLVRFLDDDPLRSHTATIIVMNVNGISKTSFNLDNITILKNNSTCNDNSSSWWNKLPFFPQSSLKQEFFFPLKIQAELKKLYQNTPCLELLSRSIENDYFMVEDYKDRVQVVEMYNLRSNKLEMIFHQRSESAITSFGHGSPAVAISRHKSLMAYCRGANSITIYLMENSLEISTQLFPRVERIISLDFINDDETLLIIAHEKDDSSPLIIVWDLFSYMDNAIRVLQDTKKLFTSQYCRLVRSCGNILLVDNSDGSILSILDHPLIKDMLIPTSRSKQSLTQLPLHYLQESEWDQAVYHTLFYQDGKHYDAETQDKNLIIASDKEPWVHNKDYRRISAYLDDEKTTQLFIGETSVQVWYRKDVDSKRELKYIWVSPTNRKLSINSLEVGHREFKVNLSSRSIQSYREENVINIHWPFKVNAVNDACSSLRYLYDRRDDPAGPKKQQQYENLVNRIEKIVRKFIKKRPAIWRLIDVRYDVMGNLIYGRRVHLIQQILNSESDFSMKYLHIPRLYEWPKKPKISDMEIAIKCTEGRRQRDAVMIGFLLDYYSDNAMDNIGWMFTVSRTVPLLFEHHLDTYAKDLFSKPIFGAKEIHLDESHINPEDLPRGKLKYIKAFNQNTGLIPKPELTRDYKAFQPVMDVIDQSKSKFTQNQQLAALQKVIPKVERGDSSALLALRSVPLPDFTVYPEGTKIQELNIRALPFQLLRILLWPRGYAIRSESKLSPFIRVIRKDRDGIVFDNPAMEAVIDYKWESARSHFLRQTLLFSTFAILFGVLTGAVKNSFVSYETSGVNRDGGKTIINLMIILFYYLGYYLLASEIVQFSYEGWKRYISVYNFFDLASIIMPLATYTVILIRETNDSGSIPPNQLKQLTIATSFTILVLWIEMFLLLRYFAITGNFIYIVINIVRNVWPFIAFMGIVVFAHGHAMYLLLRNPASIGVGPDGSQFQVVDQSGQPVFPGQSIQQTFDLDKATDNYFSNFAQSVTAVYFWINGRWDQLPQWNFWPVTVLSFVASVLLVIIMQNMLIAFMTGVFDEAKSEGRLAVLKYRSELIAEYEILEKPFGNTRENPRHIFYIGNINKLSRWLRKCEYYWKLRASSKSKETFYEYNKYDDDDDDDDDDGNEGGDSKEWDITGLDVDSYEQKNINLMNRKSRIEFYSSWSTNTADSVNNEKKSSNDGSTKEKKVQFKDTSIDDSIKTTTSEIISPIFGDASNIREEIVSLKDSMKTIEGSIDNRLNLLDDKLADMMNLLNKLATINNLNSGDTS